MKLIVTFGVSRKGAPPAILDTPFHFAFAGEGVPDTAKPFSVYCHKPGPLDAASQPRAFKPGRLC